MIPVAANKKLSCTSCSSYIRKPVKIVFELNTERDDIELLGRVEIVAILKGGKLLDSEDETWNLKDVYPLSDVEKIIDKV